MCLCVYVYVYLCVQEYVCACMCIHSHNSNLVFETTYGDESPKGQFLIDATKTDKYMYSSFPLSLSRLVFVHLTLQHERSFGTR